MCAAAAWAEKMSNPSQHRIVRRRETTIRLSGNKQYFEGSTRGCDLTRPGPNILHRSRVPRKYRGQDERRMTGIVCAKSHRALALRHFLSEKTLQLPLFQCASTPGTPQVGSAFESL
jgi:hypothetical protein